MIIEREDQVTEAVLNETSRIEDPRLKQIVQSLIRHLHGICPGGASHRTGVQFGDQPGVGAGTAHHRQSTMRRA